MISLAVQDLVALSEGLSTVRAAGLLFLRLILRDEMSLPGLGLDEPEEVQTIETSQHDLAKENEWRFEVAVGKYVQVKVCLRVDD